MTDAVNVPREAVERFKDALENMPDVLECHAKGQKFNAYDLDDGGGSKAVCIGPITSRPLSLFTAPADVAELVEASLKLAANALAAAPKAEPVDVAAARKRMFGSVIQVSNYGGLDSPQKAFMADLRLLLYTHPAPASDELLEALAGLLSNAEVARMHMAATEVGMLVGSSLFETILNARAAIAKHKGPQS